MDKKILTQYMDLQKEAQRVREKISRIEEELREIEAGGTVVDTVTGGEGGIQRYKIEGFPYPEYSRKRTSLLFRRAALQDLEGEIYDTIVQIEEFIKSIDDSRMRRIIDLRFVQGLSWVQVAHRIGGNTEASVKMQFKRFMEKK